MDVGPTNDALRIFLPAGSREDHFAPHFAVTRILTPPSATTWLSLPISLVKEGIKMRFILSD
jgi:hypothetical protein